MSHLTLMSLSHLHCTSYLLSIITVTVLHICNEQLHHETTRSLTTYVWCASGFAMKNDSRLTLHRFNTFSMFFCVRALFAKIILNGRTYLAIIQRCTCYILCLVSDVPYPCICMRHCFRISYSIFGSTLN